MTNFLNNQNASYDKLAKHFLSRKSILAQILKYIRILSTFLKYQNESYRCQLQSSQKLEYRENACKYFEQHKIAGRKDSFELV